MFDFYLSDLQFLENTSGQPKQCHETLQLQNPRLDKLYKNALANI